MRIKFYKPTSPGRRFASKGNFNDISKRTPEKRLTYGKKRISGRDSSGKISTRFRGGGHKRKYRIVCFRRGDADVPGRIVSIEYDPNRSARISLVHYLNGEKKYILTPKGIMIGQYLESGRNAKACTGNFLPIKKIPLGSLIHNIEIYPSRGGQLVRSAGTYAQLLARDRGYANVKMPSGEHRRILTKCFATIGQVSNSSHSLVHYGKAGRRRWLGNRPHNRGVSMNPVDHPLGGGEGKTSGGRHPSSPWGKPTKGLKTRNNRRTDKMIIRKK